MIGSRIDEASTRIHDDRASACAFCDTVLRTHFENQKLAMQAMVPKLDNVIPLWRALQARVPVKLAAVRNERHYKAMTAFMNELVDKIGDRQSHPLAGLLDVIAMFVRDYEESNVEMPKAPPSSVLCFLMKQRELRPIDLADLFGTSSNVREVLDSKREIEARQALALGQRFGVSPAVFL